MQFFNLPITFSPLVNHAIPTFVARVNADEYLLFAQTAKQNQRRLVSLWGVDCRQTEGVFLLQSAFDLVEGLVCLALAINEKDLTFPDISPIFPTANRLQRAAFDMLGIAAKYGDKRPWLRHANWDKNYFPLRFDAPHQTPEAFPLQNERYDFVQVIGQGVHEIPVGPIHAGIIEPGQFRFSVVGERVLRLEERLGWKHKGISRRFIGMNLDEGARLAGRISGDSTVAFSFSFAQAAENLCQTQIPSRASFLRAILLERERILNHLGDLAYLGNDVALAFALMQFLRLKEDCMRVNAEVFGHRLLMDKIILGGVLVDLSEQNALRLLKECDFLETEIRALRKIFEEHAGLQDRFIGTGIVSPKTAQHLGLIGLAGRASAQKWDLRVNHPVKPYTKIAPKMVVYENGDVAARANVRFDELLESLTLMRKLIVDLPKGAIVDLLEIPEKTAENNMALGWIEGFRGDVLTALSIDKSGKIAHAHCHEPSWHNWQALEFAVIDNIVPDFPLINKSFNLSYAGVDL